MKTARRALRRLRRRARRAASASKAWATWVGQRIHQEPGYAEELVDLLRGAGALLISSPEARWLLRRTARFLSVLVRTLRDGWPFGASDLDPADAHHGEPEWAT